MGFDPTFIQGCQIPFPNLAPRVRAAAFQCGEPIDHERFSIIFNEERGLAVVTAHNIDGGTIIPEGEIDRNDRFRLDPDVPKQLQIDNDRGYRNNPWDRGHLVRRRALHWGEKSKAIQADSESFFWTNIAPQHNKLHSSAWGKIEDWILDFTDDSDKQVSIFTGPVFTPEDPEHQNQPDEIPMKIPAGFWKILSLKRNGELRAAAFLVWQRDFDRADPVEFDPIMEQVRISTLEFLTGLSFEALRQADPLRFGTEPESADFQHMRERSPRSRNAAIMGPEDIVM